MRRWRGTSVTVPYSTGSGRSCERGADQGDCGQGPADGCAGRLGPAVVREHVRYYALLRGLGTAAERLGHRGGADRTGQALVHAVPGRGAAGVGGDVRGGRTDG